MLIKSFKELGNGYCGSDVIRRHLRGAGQRGQARGAKIQELLAATAAYTVVLVAFLGTSNGPEVASRD